MIHPSPQPAFSLPRPSAHNAPKNKPILACHNPHHKSSNPHPFISHILIIISDQSSEFHSKRSLSPTATESSPPGSAPHQQPSAAVSSCPQHGSSARPGYQRQPGPPSRGSSHPTSQTQPPHPRQQQQHAPDVAGLRFRMAEHWDACLRHEVLLERAGRLQVRFLHPDDCLTSEAGPVR
jgi:hypothetical protein